MSEGPREALLCPACTVELPSRARFCPSCGAAISSVSQMPTGMASPPQNTAKSPALPQSPGVGRLISSDSIPVGGFTPGVILAERYRIIGLLGRGGMGEVYRADDLKLGQPVALKFLPKALSEDPVRRERFIAEVRIARQVSHPNICRVYDIGELENQHFLSMEYIDGEDLASLLKRIGHLHSEKALDIARQLCAGLAAAHDKGVLHRDLKPANVMIDGRGRVRITDFGLALAADEESSAGEISGTPAYMAPEQLAGKGSSVRSDIYALGLVLYELYTGKKAFQAPTLAELRAKKESETPTAPSEITREMDPVVERVILRCVEKDPRARPPSVAQVASALPGGDPLAAALAAGETPSPEMVAASVPTEGLRPIFAWALLAAFALVAFLATLLGQQSRLFNRLPLQKSPEVLAERARDILRNIGYTDAPADSAFGIREDSDYFRYSSEHDKSASRWDSLPPSAVQFWYRQSPRALERTDFIGFEPHVRPNDPPLDVSGEVLVYLDTRGNLIRLTAVPAQVEETADSPKPPAWEVLFREAGLNPADWTATASVWTPMFFADARTAWTGPTPGGRSIPVRLEAAGYRGKPVYFEFVHPWTRPSRAVEFKTTAAQRAGDMIAVALLAVLIAGGLFFARRNLRLGRGDRRGALRLALFVLTLIGVSWLLGESHVATFHEVYLFLMFVGWALFVAGFLWALYIALEPYLRRNWPATIVSWSRLLAGNFRDPLVGRDLLLGCALGALWVTLNQLHVLLPGWLGSASGTPHLGPPDTLLGALPTISAVMTILLESLFIGLGLLFIFFLLRLILRRELIAALAFMLIFAGLDVLGTDAWLIHLVIACIFQGLTVFVLARFGLATMITGVFVSGLLRAFPITLQVSAWYAGIGFAGLAFLAALAAFAFYTSLGGRPVFGGASLGD